MLAKGKKIQLLDCQMNCTLFTINCRTQNKMLDRVRWTLSQSNDRRHDMIIETKHEVKRKSRADQKMTSCDARLPERLPNQIHPCIIGTPHLLCGTVRERDDIISPFQDSIELRFGFSIIITPLGVQAFRSLVLECPKIILLTKLPVEPENMAFLSVLVPWGLCGRVFDQVSGWRLTRHDLSLGKAETPWTRLCP